MADKKNPEPVEEQAPVEITLEEQIAEADAKVAEARDLLNESKRLFDEAQKERDALIEQRDAKPDPHANTRAIRAVIERSNESRAERVRAAKAAAALLGSGKSVLDQALSNRRRPTPSGPVQVGTTRR